MKSDDVQDADVLRRALFREVNQEIALLARRFEGQDDAHLPVRFVCECGDEDCLEPVRVTLITYEKIVRSEPPRFLISARHADGITETVIAAGADYLIVELDRSRQVA